jgi:hypothetical protein
MIDELTEKAKQYAQSQGRSMAPGKDWVPTALVDTPSGRRIVQFDPDFMASAELRELFYRGLLPNQLIQMKARGVAFLVSVWLRIMPAVTPEQLEAAATELRKISATGIRNSPERVDSLYLHVVTPEAERVLYSRVTRPARSSPVLGEWEQCDTPMMTGRIAEGIRSALTRE